MSRISKEHEERKNEIIDVAEELFLAHGFEKTAVSDIVRKIGVAQGLFYYYFKSKEEVIDTIADRYAEAMLESIAVIAKDGALNASAKIRRIFMAMFDVVRGKGTLVDQIHQKPYEEMHRRLSARTMEKLIPIFAVIIREGMEQGFYSQNHPEVTAEILLTGFGHYSDRMARAYCGQPEFEEKLQIAIDVLELALGPGKERKE